MKNTFRKSSLITSVALLLIAIVALSGATFAWFSTSTQSTASGINATTTAASSLEIADSSKQWGTSVDYEFGTANAKQKMIPASSANGTNWYTANSIDGTGAVKADTISSVAATNKEYVFKQELNIKNTGAVTVNGVTITINGLAGESDFARIALVPKAGTDAITTNGTFAECVYANSAETYYPVKADGSIDNSETSNAVSITAKTDTEITVGDLDAGQMAFYDLYVWFEGQDAQCTNANSGQELAGISFTVTGTPAA